MCASSESGRTAWARLRSSATATSTTTTPRSVRRSTAWTEDDASIVPFVCFPFAS